jgi:hypothetical protein
MARLPAALPPARFPCRRRCDGVKHSHVQLPTIEGLLSGQQRAEHPDHAPDLNFKKARAGSNAARKELI